MNTGRRQLRVYFYTTSLAKYMQATYVLSRHDISLFHIRRATREYEEVYTGGTRHLLEQAIRELNRRFGESYLLFIEDTSARIEALSDEAGEGFPGLRVKEWFKETTFNELNEILEERRDRRAVVSSDIALRVPGLEHPVIFHGESSGHVAETPSSRQHNDRYPWLSSSTFNGWFVPDGCDRPLSDLPLKESFDHDFRHRALEQLAQRLAEYTAVLNAPSPHKVSYRVGPHSELTEPITPPLFRTLDRPLLVLGYPCAGKSTFGLHVKRNYSAKWFEASDVLFDELAFDDAMPDADNAATFRTASKILSALGSDVVAHYILQQVERPWLNGFVVTGFRTLEEVLTFLMARPDTLTVWVEAGERARFQRQLDDTERPNLSLTEFQQRDCDQRSLGALGVMRELVDLVVYNEYEMRTYFHQIDSVIGQAGNRETSVDAPGTLARKASPDLRHDQLYKCLRAIEQAGHPLNTSQIQAGSIEFGPEVRQNNANKVLKQHPGLVHRLEPSGRGRLRYGLRPAGLAYLRLVESLQHRERPVRTVED